MTSTGTDIDSHRGFPSELTDEIIDHALFTENTRYGYPDPRVLGACSLVCRSWLNRARYHLFRRVWLGSNFLGRSRAFIVILSSPLSTIAPFVWHLSLEGGGHEGVEGMEEWYEWQTTTLRAVRALSHVKHLWITQIHFDELAEYGQPTRCFFDSFPKLKELVFYRCHFATFRDFTNALSCPFLTDISLGGVRVYGIANLMDPPPSLPRLKSLDIAFPITDTQIHMMMWFSSSKYLSTLETLLLSDVRAPDSPYIAAFVHTFLETPRNTSRQLATGYNVLSRYTFVC